MKGSKLAEGLKLIALLSLAIPTALMLMLSPLWWSVASIKVFAGYLLGIIGTAFLLGAISVHDENQSAKGREHKHNG